MAQDMINPLSNLSYVNKDFETIYPELLDLVKQLTYKWDPSISNESDPGVILLKLNALIADKCNYNIDKNVLECFPLSVTQESNARQLFEQLGYYMKWYRSAETTVSMKWIGDISSNTSYTIPAFTMVADFDNSVIYTLIGPDSRTSSSSVADQKLSCNGDILTFKAIQGVAVEYDINGDTLITVSRLDKDHRLYFDTVDIAENGIFITNAGVNNYSSWERKDNLLVEDLGNNYYSFGVSKDGDKCYIEFPDDVEELFKEGVYITYVRTLGAQGNVAATAIEKFYNDLIPEEAAKDSGIILNSDNVKMQNISAATSGKDPETINEAYKNYKRTVGTFNTLVTIRDYINSILSSNLVSNCFVTDRTNDPQSTYKIVTTNDNQIQESTFIENKNLFDPEAKYQYDPVLNAFSLKLYLLQYLDNVETTDQFDTTFEMMNNSSTNIVERYIEDKKSIQHDYSDLLPSLNIIGHTHPLYFKNVYPVNCRITTQFALTKSEAEEVATNVMQNLFNVFNAKELDFGEAISTDLVYETIENADSRIKKVTLDNIEYEIYAVYYDGTSFVTVQLNQDTERLEGIVLSKSTPSFDTLVTNLEYDNYHSEFGDGFVRIKYDYDNPEAAEPKLNYYMKTGHYLTSETSIKWEKDWQKKDLEELLSYGITIDTNAFKQGYEVQISPSYLYALQNEIYAKSVLAGRTQLFVHEETFDYKLNQVLSERIDNIERISGSCEIIFKKDEDTNTSEDSKAEYTLRANENIQFYAPNLIDWSSYSDYCKYEYYITHDVSSNSNYQLDTGEYIILYWKEDDSESSIYKYCCYGRGNIFCPTFAMPAKEVGSQSSNIGNSLTSDLETSEYNIGTNNNPIYIKNSNNEEMSPELSGKISGLTTVSNVLSGSKKITTKRVNQIIIKSEDCYCYWVLNDSENGKYILFKEDTSEHPAESSYKRVLNPGEYFIYSNSALTDLSILGSGTEITRIDTKTEQSISTGTWAVDVIDSTSITELGAEALSKVWFTKMPSGTGIKVTENQYVSVGPGSSVKLEGSNLYNEIELPKDGIRLADKGVDRIAYKLPSDQDYTYLENLTLSQNQGSWEAKTMLSINFSSTTPQILLEHQHINYIEASSEEDENQQTEIVINGAEKTKDTTLGIETDYYPCVLLGSLSIQDSSGDWMNSFTEDTSGNKKYLSIYLHKQIIDYPEDENVEYNSRGEVIMRFTDPSLPVDKHDVYFSLPVGEYILEFNNQEDAIDEEGYVNFTLDDTDNMTDMSRNIYDFKKPKTYYVYLNIAKEHIHKITVGVKGHKNEVVFSFKNPYRFTKPEGITDDEFEEKRKDLVLLDESNMFAYTYEVPADEEITNPLDSASFLLTNHIFNKNTICKLDTTANTSVNILGKK